MASDQTAQIIDLVAEARLCCDSVVVGIDSVLARLIVPGAIAEMNALKRMAQRSAEAMDALQVALQSPEGERSDPADQQCSVQLEIGFKALEFYADSDNYNRRAANKPSPVAVDKGRIARDAIEAITPDTGESEGQE